MITFLVILHIFSVTVMHTVNSQTVRAQRRWSGFSDKAILNVLVLLLLAAVSFSCHCHWSHDGQGGFQRCHKAESLTLHLGIGNGLW